MIREAIIARRKELGISQLELAERVGCRPATLSDFEREKKEMRSGLIEKILATLQLEVTSKS